MMYLIALKHRCSSGRVGERDTRQRCCMRCTLRLKNTNKQTNKPCTTVLAVVLLVRWLKWQHLLQSPILRSERHASTDYHKINGNHTQIMQKISRKQVKQVSHNAFQIFLPLHQLSVEYSRALTFMSFGYIVTQTIVSTKF